MADEDDLPLNYQLFAENAEENLEAVTERKSEPSMSIVGKPATDSNGTRKYVIKVGETV